MIYVSSSGVAKRIEDMVYPYLVNARRKLAEALEDGDAAMLERQQVHPTALLEAMDVRLRELDTEREATAPPADDTTFDGVEFGS